MESPSLFCFLIFLLFVNAILVADVSDINCSKPWFIRIDKGLTVFWSGDDRETTVTANITTRDTYGRNCDNNVFLQEKFSTKVLTFSNPCSNAFYSITVALLCDAEQHNLNVRTPPDAPSNVDLTATNKSIQAAWSSPPGPIQLYKVILHGGRRNEETRENLTSSSSWIFTDLEPYTDYNITVSAKNEDHWSKMSQVKTIRTLEGVPFKPRNVRAANITIDKIALKWDDPEPETGPIIEYYITYTENGTTDPKTGISKSTSYIIENLLPYTMYFIQVAATNAIGIGPFTSLITVTALAVPEPPRIKAIEATYSTIYVKWELSTSYRGPDPEYSLRWKQRNGEDQYDSVDFNVSSQENHFIIRKLQPLSTYDVQIRARNGAGFSSWSATITIDTATGYPSKPRNLQVPSKSATYATISWDVPDPANGVIQNYTIAWRRKLRHFMTEYTNDTYFYATDLAPYTDYEFKVCAATSLGWGNWSSMLKIKTDVGVPSEPLNLTESGVTSSNILIEWLAPEHKNGPYLNYIIKWKKTVDDPEEYDNLDDDNSATTDSSFWSIDEVNTTSYEISNLDSYTNYSIVVCGRTSEGLGNCTNSLVIQTRAGIPSSPDGIKTVKVQSTSMFFQWFPPKVTSGPLEGYVIHWGVTGTDGSYILTNMTSYECLGLRPYTEYFFMVAAETRGGRGPFNSVYRSTAISTPSVPRNLVSSSVTDHCVLLSWSTPQHPNAPFVQYTVKWRQVTSESSTQVHETNSTFYRIRDLLPQANYSIQISALTDAGAGPWTEVLSIRTLKKDNSSAIIAGSVVGSLLVLILIACAVLFYLAKSKGGLKHVIFPKSSANSSETLQTTVPLDIINPIEKVKVQNFDEHVLKLMTHGYCKLTQEFEKLGKESPTFSTNEAKKNDNLTKNRWVKILPFDHSRVKLLPVGDEVEPDFINASYVPGNSYLLEYIAAQGPLPNTVNDFWKMVWQESVFLMVMLAQCVERAKRTCEKYWPAAGTTNKYGDVEVHTISESITPAYIHRLFLVTKDGKQRHIVHLHYMNWPVSGCPKSPEDFLSFVKTVRGQVSCSVTGPILIHCSAGIGRTGTFIAVDRLSQQLTRQCDEVDIFGTVLEMRRYRANLVQTEDQYYFIHLCLQRIIQEKRQEIEDDYEGGIYSN